MKIEKVNDHQIRCTLTREDLADRELKLSELAYGTEKAKDLFRDMMQQASFEFGFEAEDIPLMIEAIPLNSECIVLIITKVEDPEELDTRFSKFAPSVHDEPEAVDDMLDSLAESADDVLDLFKKIQNKHTQNNQVSSDVKDIDSEIPEASSKEVLTKKSEEVTSCPSLAKLYAFKTLNQVIELSKVLTKYYTGSNSLYKRKDGSYLLLVYMNDHTPTDFRTFCNILSEYGSLCKLAVGSEAYLEEHFEAIIKDTALQSLSCIS